MKRKTLKILGVNPGTRYLGIAVFHDSELLDWRVKTFKGKWSEKKIEKAIKISSEFIELYEPDVLVIKKLHPARRTENLLKLANRIKQFSRRKGLKVFQYSIKEIEKSFIEAKKLNIENLIQALARQFPMLHHDLNKERSHKNMYYFRMFEAVALAAVCYRRLS